MPVPVTSLPPCLCLCLCPLARVPMFVPVLACPRACTHGSLAKQVRVTDPQRYLPGGAAERAQARPGVREGGDTRWAMRVPWAEEVGVYKCKHVRAQRVCLHT